jgi:integrase
MATIWKPSRVVDGRRVKSRKWYVAFRDPSQGGRRVKHPGYTDKEATRELGRKLEREAERKAAGLEVADRSRSAEPIKVPLEAYLAELDRSGASAGYRKRVRSILERLVRACHWPNLASVRADTLRAFLQAHARKGRSARSQNDYRNKAARFLGWCVAQGWVEGNPLTKVGCVPENGKNRVRPRRSYTDAELTALFSLRNARTAVYRLAAFSGLRRSDLARLRVADADLTDPRRPRWRLRAEAVKEGRSAVLPMLPECADVVAALVKGKKPGDRLVHVPTDQRTLYADLKRANVSRFDDSHRRLDFHSFRYYFCTLLARSLPIQKVRLLMRHRDIRTTCNLYMDLGIDDVAEAFTLPRLFGAGPAPQDAPQPAGGR